MAIGIASAHRKGTGGTSGGRDCCPDVVVVVDTGTTSTGNSLRGCDAAVAPLGDPGRTALIVLGSSGPADAGPSSGGAFCPDRTSAPDVVGTGIPRLSNNAAKTCKACATGTPVPVSVVPVPVKLPLLVVGTGIPRFFKISPKACKSSAVVVDTGTSDGASTGILRDPSYRGSLGTGTPGRTPEPELRGRTLIVFLGSPSSADAGLLGGDDCCPDGTSALVVGIGNTAGPGGDGGVGGATGFDVGRNPVSGFDVGTPPEVSTTLFSGTPSPMEIFSLATKNAIETRPPDTRRLLSSPATRACSRLFELPFSPVPQ